LGKNVKKNIVGMLPEDLVPWLGREGEPSYRARQILRWVYEKKVSSFRDMSDIPLGLREKLSASFVLGTTRIAEVQTSSDGTKKFLLVFPQGDSVEVVAIPQRSWYTVCLSTQVGCPVRCPFCATGRAGFRRPLAADEIVEEAWRVSQNERARITHLVFMGMGEPLLNYGELTRALRVFNSSEGFGIGSRRITVSTVGVPEKILQLARDWPEVNLALSLHAPSDDLRNFLVPLNRTYPLKEVLAAVREYLRLTRRRVTIEYTLWQGLNDGEVHALQLSRLLRGLLVHVNLIPGNRIKGTPFVPSPPERVVAFAALLQKHGIPVTLRRSRGQDIRAACGELYRIHGLRGEVADDYCPEKRCNAAGN
jgi:23S rRNA (adenine2503-C2)-methyltransferase